MLTKKENNEIKQIYQLLIEEFNKYKDQELILISYLENKYRDNKRWRLLNEINISEPTKMFNDYEFSCICKMESIKYIKYEFYNIPKNNKLIDDFEHFCVRLEDYFVLRLKIIKLINYRQNFKDMISDFVFGENTYINIFVHRDDIILEYEEGSSFDIKCIDFINTFLNFYVKKIDYRINNNICIITDYPYNDKVPNYVNNTFINIVPKNDVNFEIIKNYLNGDMFKPLKI